MKRTILVVDDSSSNLSMLNECLKDFYKVIVAKNGKKALELLSEKKIDLVLLDVVMPEMDGYEVCRQIKNTKHTEDIPIIFLTALGDSADEQKGLLLGAADYIIKPFSPPIVRARVETQIHLLEKKEHLEETLADLEKSNRFIQKTFGRYLSDDVVHMILRQGEGLHLVGEQKEVTIMMSDIRGFTSICEKLTPKDVVWVINCYLEAMTDIILEYQGTITEFIGDAILAVFGAPLPMEDSSIKAMACALDMQNAMDQVNEKCAAQGYPDLRMGIGLHTGSVIVGNIGSSNRLKYGIVGHNVNVAARVESYTVGGQILISEPTFQPYTTEVELRKSIEVSPKGVSEPMLIYELLGLSGRYQKKAVIPSQQLDNIPQPIKLEIKLMDGKYAQDEIYEAYLISLNVNGLVGIRLSKEISAYSDIKIAVCDDQGQCLQDNLYAKKVPHNIRRQKGSFIL